MPDYGYGHNVNPFVLRVPATSTWVNVRNVVTVDSKAIKEDAEQPKSELTIVLSNKRVVQTTVAVGKAREFMEAVFRGSNVYQK